MNRIDVTSTSHGLDSSRHFCPRYVLGPALRLIEGYRRRTLRRIQPCDPGNPG